MNRGNTDAILGGWKLKELAGNGESHETRQTYFPTEEQRRKDGEICDITATTRLFLKLNFAQPAAGCRSLCFTAWPARVYRSIHMFQSHIGHNVIYKLTITANS